MNLKQMLEELEKLNRRISEIAAKGADATPEEVAEANEADKKADALEAQIKDAQKASTVFAKAKRREAWLNDPATDPVVASGKDEIVEAHSLKHIVVPAAAKRTRVTSFKSDEFGSATQKAYAFGKFILGALLGDEDSRDWCKDNGIAIIKVRDTEPGRKTSLHSEGVNSVGGVLVPPEFENDLIDLREKYGVFRQYAHNTTMRSDTKNQPRRTQGLTAYFVGEGQTITDSTKGWDQVGLTAKKLAVLAFYSSELDEDSIIELGNDFAKEIAYAFAKKEDQCGFLGDGTSTYGRITGVAKKLLAVDNTIANIKGLVVASGNAFSEFTLADFNNVVGALPEYADDSADVAWYCHRTFYFDVMVKLMMAAGGVTAAEIAMGRREKEFMGYPVRITQTMPKTDANSQISCLFGNLDLAALYGDRRQTTIALSTDLKFAEDQIAIRGTERFDINVHDVGDTTDAGPIVGLISAAS